MNTKSVRYFYIHHLFIINFNFI